MAALVLNARDVRALLRPADCIDALEDAFLAAARGEVVQPLRVAAWRPDAAGAIAAMPAFIGEPPVLGAKVIAVFPQNRSRGLPSHQGVVLLHDALDGQLLAIVDAGAITALRTAAASALATRLLAREDAGVLALLGSGVQAAEHLTALCAVRPIREVRVYSRTPAHAHAFAAREAERHGLPVRAVPTAAEAVRGADIVCTLTAATEPILLGRWLLPGMHVNAVGASTPAFRELDAEAVACSRLFADRSESARAESADFLQAVREGAISDEHLRGDLADLVSGRVRGRETAQDITLFKSLGLALEDLAAAHRAYREAVRRGHGISIEIGEGEGE